jgi:5-methylcytosine-specific restriction endonuclease McrA
MDQLKKFGKKIIYKNKHKRKRKTRIPKAIREQCWLKNMGEVFETTCYIHWCKNKINVFNFQVGHDIPESKGGSLNIDNLKPICCRCNLSMGNRYTIQEWNKLKNK